MSYNTSNSKESSSKDTHRPHQPAVVSVLRKTGSFASLQVQKNIDPPSPHEPRKTKVTVIHSNDLPNYSTERYYMLSEIQLKAHSTIFLRDLFPLGGRGQDDDDDDDDDDTQDLSSNGSSLGSVMDENTNDAKKSILSSSSNNSTPRISDRDCVVLSEEKDNNTLTTVHRNLDILPQGLPYYIVLYLLWRPDCIHQTPEAYAKHIVKFAVDQMFQLYKMQKNDDKDANSCDSDPFIYLVVDRLVYKDCISQTTFSRESEIAISEQLIRTVATDVDLNLRSIIQGVTVGLSDDFRAAPGLETCMDSILVGDAERRHYGQEHLSRKKNHDLTIVRNRRELDPSRSCIGIVTEYPDDLIGIGPLDETDAVQNLSLHARSTGNWSGKGSYLNFAARAQQHWRELWDYEYWEVHDEFDLKSIGNEYSILRKRKKKNQEGKNEEESSMIHYLPSRRLKERTEKTADMMVIGFLAFVVTILWKQYSEDISEIVGRMWNIIFGIFDSVRR